MSRRQINSIPPFLELAEDSLVSEIRLSVVDIVSRTPGNLRLCTEAQPRRYLENRTWAIENPQSGVFGKNDAIGRTLGVDSIITRSVDDSCKR